MTVPGRPSASTTPRGSPSRSAAGSGKAKGEPVEAVARILPKSETRRVFDTMTKRYWWHAWWLVPQALLRGGIDKVHAAIEVEAPPADVGEAARESG